MDAGGRTTQEQLSSVHFLHDRPVTFLRPCNRDIPFILNISTAPTRPPRTVEVQVLQEQKPASYRGEMAFLVNTAFKRWQAI